MDWVPLIVGVLTPILTFIGVWLKLRLEARKAETERAQERARLAKEREESLEANVQQQVRLILEERKQEVERLGTKVEQLRGEVKELENQLAAMREANRSKDQLNMLLTEENERLKKLLDESQALQAQMHEVVKDYQKKLDRAETLLEECQARM